MINKRIRSIYGSPYEKYFENGAPDPAGDLVGGGIGLPTHRNDWWDTRDLWTYPYYNLNMMLGNGIGSYRNANGYACELSLGTFFFTFPDLKANMAQQKENTGENFMPASQEIFLSLRESNKS